MRVPFQLAAAGVVFVQLACASLAHTTSLRHTSESARLDAIRRAQVWLPGDIGTRNLRTGPEGPGAFAPDELVSCRYVNKRQTGRTPKFTCALDADDEVKVKYGRQNGEVYAEVAATRLLWALGFGADRMYPVRVECRGCPSQIAGEKRPRTALALVDPASIERKFKGHAIETSPDSGWAWPELDLVDEGSGGAPRAHRDALKLLASLIQHTDSKAAQQRLVCLSGGREEDDDATCSHPFMMINDLGQTFGRANRLNRDAVGSVNFEAWTHAPVWMHSEQCVADLPRSFTGSLDNPVISEAGRQFLAELLLQLSDAQLGDLFAVARFPLRSGHSVDDWVHAFDQKRDDVVNRRCPN
jgi:hypothetical protein